MYTPFQILLVLTQMYEINMHIIPCIDKYNMLRPIVVKNQNLQNMIKIILLSAANATLITQG